MTFDPDRYHRRSIRLPGYDYRSPGAYFVTICSQNRECILGSIIGGEMAQSDVGRMVERIWCEIPARYSGVDLDAFIVMPNHLHGIVLLVGAGPCARPARDVGPSHGHRADTGQPRGVAPTLSLSDVVHRFKSLATARYLRAVRDEGWPSFAGRLWQRNYHEHIIRNEAEFEAIRQYVADNPSRWDDDPENVGRLANQSQPVAGA
jgi:putative transposase